MMHFSSELPMSLTKIDCEQSLFCSKICESVCEMMQLSVQGVRIFWAPVQAKRETTLVSYSISEAW